MSHSLHPVLARHGPMVHGGLIEQDLYRISVLTEISDLTRSRRVRSSHFEGLGNIFWQRSRCCRDRDVRRLDKQASAILKRLWDIQWVVYTHLNDRQSIRSAVDVLCKSREGLRTGIRKSLNNR
jgi:hypothetical protein